MVKVVSARPPRPVDAERSTPNGRALSPAQNGWAPRSSGTASGVPPQITNAAPAKLPTIRETMANEAMGRLQQTPGYQALSPEDRSKLDRWAAPPGNVLSNELRFRLNLVVSSPDYRSGTAEQQAAAVHQLLTSQSFLPDVISGLEAPALPTAAYALTDSGVTIGAHTITIEHAPAPNDALHRPTMDEVARGLAQLPELNLSAVKKVIIEPNQNPGDAHFSTVYGRADFRSYMTAGADGVVRIYPSTNPTLQRSLNASLLHETGHTISLQKWGNYPETDRKWKPWREAAASDGLSPSAYAKTALGEDFAETFALYCQVKGTDQEASVRSMFPQRFGLIDQLTAGSR